MDIMGRALYYYVRGFEGDSTVAATAQNSTSANS